MNAKTIDGAIDAFMTHVGSRSSSEHTLVNYAADLKQFADYLERQSISDVGLVEPALLRAYLRELSGWGFARTTISRKLSSLRRFFAFLKERGILERDPARSLRGPAAPRGLPRALSEEAVGRMFDMAEASESPVRDVAVMELLYGCGLRISELTGLKWADVDLDERWIVVLGKGDKERRVPFGACARRALERLGTQRDAGPYVFSGRGGKALTVRTVHRVVTALAERAGLEGVTPHVLRHSCATHMVERGASLKFVQEFLGHESLSTTQIYLAVSASWMKESYASAHPRARAGGGLDEKTEWERKDEGAV